MTSIRRRGFIGRILGGLAASAAVAATEPRLPVLRVELPAPGRGGRAYLDGVDISNTVPMKYAAMFATARSGDVVHIRVWVRDAAGHVVFDPEARRPVSRTIAAVMA